MSKKALDKGNEYGALLTDRTKAFHCLAHGIIIAKRHAYGFSVESLKLIHSSLTLKRMGVGVSLTLLPPRYGFSKNVSSKENVKPCFFFVTLNVILRQIFPENFIEFPQVVQKI